VVSIAAVIATGWLARRSFAPLTSAEHAAIAAYAIVALAAPAGPAADHVVSSQSPRTWQGLVSRLGFVLLLLQIALGALVRHQLMPIVWHVLVGGLAALAILVPAVAITYEPFATRDAQVAARWAIASILVQVSLGIGVLLMILVGTPDALSWLVTTGSHVVAASLTLLAVANLTRVLRTPRAANDTMPVRLLP
jgi:heme A synthase